jgi:hypothetical protein
MITQAIAEPDRPTWPLASIENIASLARIPFDQVPTEMVREAFGVRYAELPDVSGGSLWVNRHGWNHLEQLDPARWFFEKQYSRRGKWLSEGSGAVYRVSSCSDRSVPIDLVVKFSRMAQDLHVDVSSTFPGDIPRHVVDEASFNDPFQEFGLVEELRTSPFGPSDLKILTKRPLAIYSPARRFDTWQLGRSQDRFRGHCLRLERDQENKYAGFDKVDLAMERQYIMVFHWIRGVDAQELGRHGILDARESTRLVRRVIEELAAKGFRVLDTKPNHIILRRRRDGRLLSRRGKLEYALVDFELLQRTPEYERWRQRRAVNQPGAGNTLPLSSDEI